ncbi:MAG: zinc-binding dehydrogenase [Hyphomicrobiaceae bacterium]|nr:zinc-binding dehydrogenase [Hyphomicrobiaceae bacterium]
MFALQNVADRELVIGDIEPPKAPGPDEVQIRMKAVALNHIDVWSWRGMAFAKRADKQIPGAEGAGEIVAVGENVKNLQPGQLVAIYGAITCGTCDPCQEGRDNHCTAKQVIYGFHTHGFFQELINVPARLAVPAPEGLPVEQAALAGITFGTPEHMLFDNAKLKAGETVLVQAGGSGIGSAAIQLIKAVGGIVYTTVGSDEKGLKAVELGADEFINYKKERFEGRIRRLTKKRGVDVVFEHIGPDTFKGSMLSMRRGGKLVTCGSTTGVMGEINLNLLYQQQLHLLGSFGCTLANMASVMQKLADGTVKPVIDTVLPLEEVESGLNRLENRDVFGKIIVKL